MIEKCERLRMRMREESFSYDRIMKTYISGNIT